MPTRIGDRPGGGLTLPTTPLSPTPARPAPIATTPAAPTWSPGSRPPRDPFKAPKFDIVVPDNLGRPPTLADVVVKKGFDGLSPRQAEAAVVSHLETPLDPQNAALVNRQAIGTHKAFTMAVNNVFVAGSPNRAFLDSIRAQDISVLGSMTGSQPTVIKATPRRASEPHFYAKDASGQFREVPEPKFVVMEAKIRLTPPGVQVSYPDWTAPALAGPLTTITEL